MRRSFFGNLGAFSTCVGFVAAAAFASLAAAACTTVTTNNVTPGGGDVDAEADGSADEDAGTADAAPESSTTVDPNYPAPHTALPNVDFNGGRVLVSPKIVTVTFGNDTLRANLEQLGDTLTSSTWWDAVRAGYCSPASSANCVGKGSGGGHVNLPTTNLPTSFSDSSQGASSTIQEFIQQKLDDGTFPAPTTDSLYILYFPSTVTISLDGATSCNEFGGYHNTLSYTGDSGAPMHVAYAIVPRCSGSTKEVTIAASHEIIEAATDPDVGVNDVAYYMTDQVWGFAGGEVGDVCVDLSGSGSDEYLEGAYTVQRSWSNASAKAGHDPCVPIPPNQVYFNAAPASNQRTVQAAVGSSVTVDVTAFSDAPMGDWTLSAVDLGQALGIGSHLGFSFDNTTVNNGSKVKLTVTLKSAPQRGGTLYAIVATSGKTRHFWPAAVVAK